jgi:branched-chain amino acid transport system substrate-binding protein
MKSRLRKCGVLLTIATAAILASSSFVIGSSGAAAKVTGITAAQIQLVKGDKMTGPNGTGLTRGITKTSIKVGCVYDETGPGVPAGLSAYYAVNNVPIFGRTVSLQNCTQVSDTNPTSALTAVQQLVEQDHDFALMLFCGNNDCGSAVANFLNANQVPSFTLVATTGCGTRWGFAVTGCFDPEDTTPTLAKQTYGWNLLTPIEVATQGQAKSSITIGGVGIGVVPGSMAVANQTLDTAKLAGYKTLAPSVGVPLASGTDMTPYAEQVINGGANVLGFATSLSDEASMISALTANGFKGTIVDAGDEYIPGGLESTQPTLATALNGVYSDMFDLVPFEAQTPYVRQFEKGLNKIAHPASDVGLLGTYAYYGADMFSQMLKATGKVLNTKTFNKAVNGGKFVYKPALAGGPGTIAFPAGHFTNANCHGTIENVSGVNKVISALVCQGNPQDTNPQP